MYCVVPMVFQHGEVREALSTETWLLNNLKVGFGILSTSTLAFAAWIFFRSESLGQVCSIVGKIAVSPFPAVDTAGCLVCRFGMMTCICVLAIEWLQREKEHPLQFVMFARLFR